MTYLNPPAERRILDMSLFKYIGIAFIFSVIGLMIWATQLPDWKKLFSDILGLGKYPYAWVTITTKLDEMGLVLFFTIIATVTPITISYVIWLFEFLRGTRDHIRHRHGLHDHESERLAFDSKHRGSRTLDLALIFIITFAFHFSLSRREGGGSRFRGLFHWLLD